MCTPWWQSKPQPFSLKQRKLLSGPDSFTPQLKKHTNSLAVPLSNEASKTKRKYKKRRKLDSTGGGDTKAPSSGGKSSAVDLLPRPSRPRRAVATQQHWNHLLRDDEEEDDPMEEDSGEEYDEDMMNSPAPSHTGKDFRTRRRESSYDIDNIVIPYSVAATTRVEVLQYKEIPTPRWRFVEGDLVNSSTGDLTAPTTLYTHGRKNGDLVTPVDSVAFMSSDEEDGWLEDISDETLARRHEKYELEERKKFRSYVLPGFTTSRRAHKRTDSRAESSGANTPDAGSPKHQAAEFSSSHHPPPFSPLSSPPLSHSGDTGEAGQHPKRRSFNSRTMTLSESDRPPSPDSQDEVSPYSPLQFPLSDEQYARLLKDMPPGHPTMEDRNYSYEDQTAPPPVISPALSIQVQMPEPESPAALMSDSGDSSEDPNDPEWTFESKNPAALERYRTSKTKQYFEY